MAVTPEQGPDDRNRGADEGECGISDDLARSLVRVAVAPAWVALGAVGVLSALGGALSALGVGADLPAVVRYLPFLASLVVFGLPHGATDHLAVARLGGSRSRGRSYSRPLSHPWLAVGAAYLVGGGAYLAVWPVAPVLGFASFIALTWYHWGQGDLYVLRSVGDHLRTRGQRLAALAVRGGIPMVVPLVGFPGVYRSVTGATIGLFEPGLGPGLGVVFRPDTRLALGGGLAVLSLAALALGAVRSGIDNRGWRIDALETALLWAYFLVVPPILAVGLYFCLWHSVRHVARLLVVEDRGSLAPDRIAPALAGFGRDALPNTVGALVVLGGLALVAPPGTDLLSLLGLYLVLLAVLTLPHAAIVTWMDLREGVWSAER
jgi:Brp/Blh family beta-carotene 15,15'-monooxygenase